MLTVSLLLLACRCSMWAAQRDLHRIANWAEAYWQTWPNGTAFMPLQKAQMTIGESTASLKHAVLICKLLSGCVGTILHREHVSSDVRLCRICFGSNLLVTAFLWFCQSMDTINFVMHPMVVCALLIFLFVLSPLSPDLFCVSFPHFLCVFPYSKTLLKRKSSSNPATDPARHPGSTLSCALAS